MKQFFILFCTLNIFDHSKATEEFCPALNLVCKNQVIEKNTGKVIRRWLDKIRISPLCFIGEQSETIHHEVDNTFEVVRVSHGVRDGVGITFLDEAQKFVSRVTLYRVTVRPVIIWNFCQFRTARGWGPRGTWPWAEVTIPRIISNQGVILNSSWHAMLV